MLKQTQKGNDNADHLGAYDIQIAKGEKPETDGLVFEFTRKVALVRLEITAPTAATWSSVSLESDALFTTEAKMNLDLESPTVTSISTSNIVTLNLENVSTTNENLSIIAYMMLLPVDLTGKTLSVKLTDSGGVSYSSSATITNNKTNLSENSARWITADFLPPNNQIWYTSSDGNIVKPYSPVVGLDNVVSNVYENGRGVITFNTDVTSIKDEEFFDCGRFTSITLPNSVTSIGNGAFNLCRSLTNITIPNNVTVIGDNAFKSCTSLIDITLSEKLTVIGNSAFLGCTSLTNIAVPSSVEVIGDDAFSGCTSLTNIVISNGVNTIGEGAFAFCKSLKNINLPNTTKAIGRNAFYGCSSFTSIIIPNSVTAIGKGAFIGCESLSNIVVEEGNSIYDSRENCNAIIETATNTLITGINTTVIPNGVTTIGDGAFYGCTSLTNVTIPNGVTTIGDSAFYGCI